MQTTRQRAITQTDISDLIGDDPRRGEGSLVTEVQDWLEYREGQEPESERLRRLR